MRLAPPSPGSSPWCALESAVRGDSAATGWLLRMCVRVIFFKPRAGRFAPPPPRQELSLRPTTSKASSERYFGSPSSECGQEWPTSGSSRRRRMGQRCGAPAPHSTNQSTRLRTLPDVSCCVAARCTASRHSASRLPLVLPGDGHEGPGVSQARLGADPTQRS